MAKEMDPKAKAALMIVVGKKLNKSPPPSDDKADEAPEEDDLGGQVFDALKDDDRDAFSSLLSELVDKACAQWSK